MNNEIVVKQYTANENIKQKGPLKLWVQKHVKKIGFYGVLTLITAAAPLIQKHNDKATENNVMPTSAIDFTLNNEISPVNTIMTETNLLVATSEMPELTLLAAAEATPTPTPTPEPRKLKDVSKTEQKKINNEIKNAGKKVDCLHDGFYADLKYLEYYLANPTLSYEDVIVRVNMGLWKELGSFVTFSDSTYSSFDETIVCLNRYAKINQDEYDIIFDKSILKEVNNTGYLLQQEPHDACEKMIKAAAKDGIKLTVTSGYLSYDEQKELYDAAVEKHGEDKASMTVEKPGYSYAQLGTKVTFKVKNGSATSKWLYKNAYKYGFAYVAPSGKSELTGYTYNPGAFHYVGTKYAKICFDKKLPFVYIWHRYIHPGVITFGPPTNYDNGFVYNPNIPVQQNVEMLYASMYANNEDYGVALTKTNSNHGRHV